MDMTRKQAICNKGPKNCQQSDQSRTATTYPRDMRFSVLGGPICFVPCRKVQLSAILQPYFVKNTCNLYYKHYYFFICNSRPSNFILDCQKVHSLDQIHFRATLFHISLQHQPFTCLNQSPAVLQHTH